MADQLRNGRGARHAVVVGGSLAGLLAARVLAEHAERVTVVERDRYPDEPEARPGVPQGRHTHVLLEGGQLALEQLLPGVVDELREQGSPRVAMPRDLVQWQGGRWFRRTAGTSPLFTGARPRLEHLVRHRVLADPRVHAVQGAEAVGLLGDATRVRGVRLRERGSGETRVLEADLVVDASGRATQAPRWLAEIGAEPPHEENIETGLAYATRLYREETPGGVADCLGIYVIPGPGQTYGGGAIPIEGGAHMVTLSGLRGDEPPTDGDAFEEYAKRLPHPLLHDWLTKARAESAVRGFRGTANVRRRYDRPGRRPAGFLATGDALCTFNPIYGQGMAVAAISAVALRDALADRRRTPTTRRVQRALLGASEQAWSISSGSDKNMPGATGNAVGSRLLDRPAAWYLKRVEARYTGDPVVGEAFRSVLALVEPVSVLLAPSIARAVLFGPVPPTPPEPPLRPEDGDAGSPPGREGSPGAVRGASRP
ncbi:NAD(P)/FAD-dependent oxidoreductase [Streptomyces ficellus]|uniref:FAD-dependent oxidoreductase n=1 Tax=Streptomyces ficellus TaxID=1977088 RepID=A0A6I6FP86_9ACTN|nr:FAD-dependent monooxygenase [Streptomyces ficellus]QGV82152.1 FAD-dependent oxidoreductase [Streptomyces ficellus]